MTSHASQTPPEFVQGFTLVRMNGHHAPTIDEIVASALRRMLDRWDDTVRQHVDVCADQMVQDYRGAMAEIEATVSERAQAKLISLVEGGLLRAFESTKPTQATAAATPDISARPGAEAVIEGQSQESSPVLEGVDSDCNTSVAVDGIEAKGDIIPFSATEEAGAPTASIDVASVTLVAGAGTCELPAAADAVSETSVAAEQSSETPAAAEQTTERPKDGNIAVDGDSQTEELETPATVEQEHVAPTAGDSIMVSTAEDGVKELFEGTVQLRVEVDGSVREVIHFIEELRRKPEIRLLQMIGDRQQHVGVWVGLREPLPLKEILLDMNGVSGVSSWNTQDLNNSERLLTVRLQETEARDDHRLVAANSRS